MATVIGDKLTSDTGQWHHVEALGSVNTQALVRYTAPSPLLLHRLGVRIRRAASSNGNAQLAVWADDGGLPGALLGYTAAFAFGSGAVTADHPLAWGHRATATGQNAAAIALAAGQTVWLGIQVESRSAEIARAVAAPTVTVYRRQTSGNPPAPFGTSTGTTAVPIPALYGVAEESAAPVATLTQPAASIATAEPVIAGTVADADSGAPAYDRLKRYTIELREQGETDLVWQQDITPSDAQRNAGTFSVVYFGPVIGEGDYQVRVQPIDDAGMPGSFTAWRDFAIENLGEIDTASAAPTGKIESGVVSGNWTARWTHPLALNANRAWVRVLSGAIPVRETPVTGVTINVADNAFIALTNAQAAVALSTNPLPPGVYTWQMQARATDGSLSPWSADVPLTVNSPPNQPSSLRPASGVTVAARPLIDWLLSDPDLDDVLGVGLVSAVEVTRPDASIWTGENGNVDPATGRGYLQLTSTHAPGNGLHQFRVRGRDTSAVGTAGEFGPWSPPSVFTLVTAPIVTVTAPTENAVVGTSTPQLAWTIADGTQAHFRVQLYRAGQTTPFFSSGQIPVAIPAASGSYSIPAGWLNPGFLYDADVTVWTAGGISSTSAKRRFAVQYADAALVPGVTVNLFGQPRDVEPVSVAVAWGPTSYPQSQFLGYVVWRRPTSDDPDAAQPIALVRSPGQLSWIDHHPPPNVPLVYAVTQLRRSGNDVQSSQPVEVEIEVPLTTPVVASLESGAALRFPVMMLSRDFGGGFERTDAAVETWGSGGKETPVRPPAGHGARPFSLGFTLVTKDGVTAQQRLEDIMAVVESGDLVSLRSEEVSRAFCRIVPRGRYWRRGAAVGTYEITLELKEIAWSEAVAIGT